MFVYPPHVILEREIEIASHMNKVLDDRKNHLFGFSQSGASAEVFLSDRGQPVCHFPFYFVLTLCHYYCFC